MRVSKLKVLQSIEEITDYLWIDANHTRLRSLNFLSNLRAVYGRHTMYDALSWTLLFIVYQQAIIQLFI